MTTFTINDKSAVGAVDKTADYFPIWKSGAQGKATASQIVASVPMVGDSGAGGSAGIVPAPGAGDAAAGKFLKANGTWTPAAGYKSASNTVYVAASGGDYTSVQDALTALSGYVLDPGIPQYITVKDGHYSVGSFILKEGAFGQATYIQGQNVYTRAVTSVASASGSAGAWSIVLNMADVTNISVNDYVACIAPSGGTLPTYLAGCHQVTNVGASTITIASKHKATSTPSGAVSANLTVFKSVLSFTATDGIRIWSGSSCVILKDICFVGDGSSNGISVQDGGGRCYIDGVVGVANFDTGVYGITNVEMNGDGAIAISGCTTIGIYATSGAYLESTKVVVSGCAYGIQADCGGIVRPRTGYSTGNTYSGCYANKGGLIIPTSFGSTGNGTWGYEADGNSIIATDTVTASTNTRGSYAPKVINTSDNNLFITNFSYGYNGSVTPTGQNVFIGYGAGNTTTGATATTTSQSSNNMGIGTYALNTVAKGYGNAAVGGSALAAVTDGNNNVGVGGSAGTRITTGTYNTAVGPYALEGLTTGSQNIAIGTEAGALIVGPALNSASSNSIYIGDNTISKADSSSNEIAIGSAVTGNGSNTATIGNSSVTDTYLAGIVHAASVASTPPMTMPGGRITLTTGTPVMQSTVTGATTVYYTPYKGRFVPIYNGTSFVITDTGGELSQATTDATKSPAAVAASGVYDIFVWNDAGTIRATRGAVWTNPTTRAAALTLLNGVLVNNVAVTNGPAQYKGTYVGTIAANASSTIDWILGTAASGGGMASLMVWNYYNRVNIITRVTDSQTAYSYTTATVREAGGSTTNVINYVCGVAEDAPQGSYQQGMTLVGAVGANAQIGVGDDATNTFETIPGQVYTNVAVALTGRANCTYQKGFGEPMLGVHYLAALEKGDGTNANTFNVGTQGELSFSFLM